MPATKTKAKTSYFDTVAPAPKKALGPKADNRDRVDVKGLADLAAVREVETQIKALKALYEAPPKAFMQTRFANQGAEKGLRPDNFRGLDGTTEASMELRKNASNWALSDEASEALTAAKIPFDTVEDMPDTYVINQEVLGNATVMAAVGEALAGVEAKFKLNARIMEHQVATKKHVVGEKTLPALFATKDRVLIERLLPFVATLAIKPTSDELADPLAAFTRVLNLLQKARETKVAD